MRSHKKKPNFFKLWLIDPFVALFGPSLKFSWTEKEAEVLDKRFVKEHWKILFFFRQEWIPDHWEFLVKVKDNKKFWTMPFNTVEPVSNDEPRWISVSEQAASHFSKGNKVKVKCMADQYGMIYQVRSKIIENKK